MSARTALYALLTIALLGATPAPAAPPAVIHIGLVPNDDAATPLLYAQRSGMFAKAGLDVHLEMQTSGAAVTAAVVAGTFDIGKSSIVPLINAHQHGLPIVIVAPASIWDGKSQFAGLLVRADQKIAAGKDLEGKVIGVQSLNDMNEIATDAWVGTHGGDPSTLKFVELPMGSAAAAIKSGRIDAAAFVQPQLENALAGGGLKLLSGSFSAVAPHYLFAAWFSTTAWVQSHPEAARDFARIMAAAAAYTNAHHAETAPWVSQFTSIPLPVVQSMVRTPQGTSLDATWLQPIIDAAVKYKILTKGFAAGELIAAEGPETH